MRKARTLMRALVAGAVAATAVASGTQLAAADASDASVPSIVNGQFQTVVDNGVPTSWNTWNPAGTATVSVESGGGPGGTNDVAITSTSGATARLALTQEIAVTDASPRRYIVSGDVEGDGLSGGFSELRVQVYDASNTVLVPVKAGPYVTGTTGWTHVTIPITLPTGSTRISVEPMLDRTPGTIRFANVSLDVDTSNGSLAATPTADGRVELTWSYVSEPTADHYAVYRAEGTAAPTRDQAHLVRTAYALSTADDTVAPGTQYTYVVAALDASGQELAVTPAETVTTPSTFQYGQQNSVLSAMESGSGTSHVSWAAADSTSSDLQLMVNGSAVDLSGQVGGTEVSAAAGDTLALKSGSTTIASTTVGAAAHPRAILTPSTLDRVRSELAAGDATITGAWDATLARIAGPDSGYATDGSAGLYRARDAAFVYEVTGNQSYADLAYTSLMAGASFVTTSDTNEGLNIARADLLLAPAYDWGYNGWTDEQRENVRHLMTRAIDILAVYHHPALDEAEKTSNWVGVVRSTELALILAARGDGDFGWYDQRVGFLTDQVAQHLDQSYTENGYTQEGWDYFHYTELYMFPSIYFAEGTGLTTLDSHLKRPAFWNLALHVASSRPKGDTTQFGVGFENSQLDGALPLLAPLTPSNALPALKSIYDQVEGVDSQTQPYDGVQGIWAVLYYPEKASSSPAAATNPALKTAILDDGPGFYAFRNRIKNVDDSLVVTSNRNTEHDGWSAAETFSLSWMSDDTTWATLGGKDYQSPLEWSKPLVDGKLEPYTDEYSTVTGAGKTISSRAFSGQGGGYLHLDGSGNFGVTTADRQEVVDLKGGGKADTIIAIRDTFGDTTSHEWDWQLRPESGVSISINPAPTAGQPNFTFVSPNGATMSGFLLDADGANIQNLDGTLRISKSGTNATFTVILATSTTGPLTLGRDTSGDAIVNDRVIPVADLARTPRTGLATFVPTLTAVAGEQCAPGNGAPVAPTASGRTNIPDAQLLVTVSGVRKEFPVTADADGNWSWTAPAPLAGERSGRYRLEVQLSSDPKVRAAATLCR